MTKRNWITLNDDGTTRADDISFQIAVTDGKVKATGSSSWPSRFLLEFNCMRCTGPAIGGPFRSEIRAPARVVRKTPYSWASGFTRLSLSPGMNVAAFVPLSSNSMRGKATSSTLTAPSKCTVRIEGRRRIGGDAGFAETTFGTSSDTQDWNLQTYGGQRRRWYQDYVSSITLTGCNGAVGWDEDGCSDGYSDNLALNEGKTELPGDLEYDTCKIRMNPITDAVDLATGANTKTLRFGNAGNTKLVDHMKANKICPHNWCEKDWCLQYWPDSSRSSDLGTNAGDAWGLYTAPCHDREQATDLKTQGTQQFKLDPITKQLKAFHMDLPTEKCVNLYPRDSDGLFWPTDSKWNSYGNKYIRGRYVSVEDCLDFDGVSESSPGASGTTQMKTGKTKEGQTWEKYSCDTDNACKLRNPRTQMCLALYPTICDNNNDKCEGGSLLTSNFNRTIVGLDDCSSEKVFRYKDMEDNRWDTGEAAILSPTLTLQQEYQSDLLSDKSRKMKDKVKVQWCKEGPGLCVDQMDAAYGGATVPKSEVQFLFNAGEMVYSSSADHKCAAAVVQSCEEWDGSTTSWNGGTCSIKYAQSGTTISVAASTLSPAKSSWMVSNQPMLAK